MAKRPSSFSTATTTEAIVVAAGAGTRLGGMVAKSMRILGDKPLFAHALNTFEQISKIKGTILIVPVDEIDTARHWINKLGFTKVSAVVPGGKERGDSVQEGLKSVASDTGWIAVHDGARPFVSVALINRVLDAAFANGAVIPAIPLTDTIREVSGNRILSTVPREKLRGVQTPQVFKREQLINAYRMAQEEGFTATDDAEIVMHFTSDPVYVVDGDDDNFKITTTEDWLRAEELWARR